MSRHIRFLLLVFIISVVLSSCTEPVVDVSKDQISDAYSISNSEEYSTSNSEDNSERRSEINMDSSNLSDSFSSSENKVESQALTSATTGFSANASSPERSSAVSLQESKPEMSKSNVSDPKITDKPDKPVNSFEAMYERALKNAGNPDRILKAMKKAKNGQPVSIVAFGGSITERYCASTQDKCYASIVAKWWNVNFPNSEVSFHNAGIGSSSTQMAAHRLINDVLPHNPDFVVIDFAVNDAEGQEYTEYLESTLRKILDSGNKPGIIMLFFCTKDGWSTQNQQTPLGFRYNLPMISWKDAVYPLIQLGMWKWSKVSPDVVHPNDLGHQLAADLVVKYLDDVKSELASFDNKVNTAIPDPITPSRFENAFKIDKSNIGSFPANTKLLSLGGFSESSGSFYGKLEYSWEAQSNDAPLVLEVTGRSIALLYRSNDPNGGVASVKVNGQHKGYMDAGYPWDFSAFVVAPYNSASAATYKIEIQMTDKPSSGETGKNGNHSIMQIYQIMIDPS